MHLSENNVAKSQNNVAKSHFEGQLWLKIFDRVRDGYYIYRFCNRK